MKKNRFRNNWIFFVLLLVITFFLIYFINTKSINPSKSNVIYEVEDISSDGSSLKYIVGVNDSLVRVINNSIQIRSSISDNTAIIYNSKEEKYGYINDNIKLIFDFPSSKEISLGSFNEGVAWVSEEFSPLKLINKKNEMLFQCYFCTETKIFSEGLSGFKNKNGRWGYMDINGNVKFILPTNVKFVGDFHEGLAKVYFNSKQNNAVLDEEGIFELDKFGYINNSGEIVIPPKFYDNFDNDYIDNSFSDGYAVIETREGLKGVIDKNGDFFLLPKYKTIINNSKGFIINSNLNQYLFIDKPKNLLKKIIELVITDKSKILIPQKKGDKFGYVNQYGEFVIQPQYSNAKFFENGRAIIEINKIENLINEKGEILLNTKVKERLLNTSFSKVNHLKSQQLSIEKIKNYFSKLNFNEDLQKLSLLFKNSELINSNDWAININSLEFLNDYYTFSIGALCINNFYLSDFDNFQFNPQYSNSRSYVPKMFLFRFTSVHSPRLYGDQENFFLNKMIELKNHLISDLKLVRVSIDNSFINKSELYLLSDFDNKVIIIKPIEYGHFDVLYLELGNLKQYIKNKRMSQLFSN